MRAAVSPGRWSQLLEMAERRLPALTRLKRLEPLPITLDRHRIYVLPTRFGLLFTLILAVMLLGALNYNNNPAMLLTCLLAAAAYQSVFQAFRTLDRLRVDNMRAEPCHAGEPLYINIHFAVDARVRSALHLHADGRDTRFDLAPRGDGRVRLEFSAERRGWRRPGRMRVSSEFPFGMFHVWSWLNPEFSALVYPSLEQPAPSFPHEAADAEARTMRGGGDELAMLRDYQRSDPLRSIAWKASARHDSLLVKEFEQRRGRDLVFDFSALRGLGREARLSRLASWVCAADAAQAQYVLVLPTRRIGPGMGADHRHACLRELALMPGADA